MPSDKNKRAQRHQTQGKQNLSNPTKRTKVTEKTAGSGYREVQYIGNKKYYTPLSDDPNVSISGTSNVTINASSTGATSTQIPSHGGLDGLTDDDHSQYMHISTARTVSATHLNTGNIKVSVDADADDVTGDSATGRITMGVGEDLNLYHGGTNSYIVNDTGNLVLDTQNDMLLEADNDLTIKCHGDGGTPAVWLRDGNNAPRFSISLGSVASINPWVAFKLHNITAGNIFDAHTGYTNKFTTNDVDVAEFGTNIKLKGYGQSLVNDYVLEIATDVYMLTMGKSDLKQNYSMFSFYKEPSSGEHEAYL